MQEEMTKKDNVKKENMKKEEAVTKLKELAKSYETGQITDITTMESVVMFFIKCLPSEKFQKITLFYNQLDVESKKKYLEKCIKDQGTGTPEQIGKIYGG